jgi:hypothetical protein
MRVGRVLMPNHFAIAQQFCCRLPPEPQLPLAFDDTACGSRAVGGRNEFAGRSLNKKLPNTETCNVISRAHVPD